MSTMTGHRRVGPVTAAEPWFDSLPQAWHAMTNLRGSLPAPTRQVQSPGLAAALETLNRALYLPGPSGQRRVPSAGAIFPYTTMVLATERLDGGASAWSLFRVTADGRVADVPAARTLAFRLARSFAPVPDERTAHLLVLNRPWMSIRKYGPRGYLYSRLDTAHALVNLLGIALETGDAWLQLTSGCEDTDELVGNHSRYHELCGVVSTRGRPTEGAGTAVAVATADTADTADTAGTADAAAEADTLEAACWSLLGNLVCDRAPHGAAVTSAPLHAAVPAEPEHDLRLSGRWSQASAMRRSTRRFGGPELGTDRIAATLAALGTPLPTNLRQASASAVHVTLFLPNMPCNPEDSRLQLGRYGRVVTARIADRSVIAAACMGQQHLREAQVFVLVSASRGKLLHEGRAGFEETLFRAGASGQLLYLGGARAGVGITTIGGFDPTRWSQLAGLPDDHELLYLAALGNEVASGAPKQDRDATASAHGER